MRVFTDSVGYMPMYALIGTVGVCIVINLAFLGRVNLHGPSAVIAGLKKPAKIYLHQADGAYAMAMAKRFCHEYYNWTWPAQLRAKSRAAFLCDPITSQTVIKAAREKNHYYSLLMTTSNAQPEKAVIVEEDKRRGHFIVEVTFTVSEWASFLPTEHEVKAQIVLGPQSNLSERPFLLEVVNYDFKPLTEPKALPFHSGQDQDEVLWDNLAANGKIIDRQYQLNAPRIRGTIIDLDQIEYEVLPTDEWKQLMRAADPIDNTHTIDVNSTQTLPSKNQSAQP